MKTTTPKLSWLANLPEAGTIRDMAKREEAMLARRAELLASVAAIDAEHVKLIKQAEREAGAAWSADEIAAAKSGRTAAVAWRDPRQETT
jgi:hypothetical protein